MFLTVYDHSSHEKKKKEERYQNLINLKVQRPIYQCTFNIIFSGKRKEFYIKLHILAQTSELIK